MNVVLLEMANVMGRCIQYSNATELSHIPASVDEIGSSHRHSLIVEQRVSEVHRYSSTRVQDSPSSEELGRGESSALILI